MSDFKLGIGKHLEHLGRDWMVQKIKKVLRKSFWHGKIESKIVETPPTPKILWTHHLQSNKKVEIMFFAKKPSEVQKKKCFRWSVSRVSGAFLTWMVQDRWWWFGFPVSPTHCSLSQPWRRVEMKKSVSRRYCRPNLLRNTKLENTVGNTTRRL